MWANRQSITGTLSLIYTVLQPITAAVLTVLLVSILHIYPNCNTNNINATSSISSSSSGGEDIDGDGEGNTIVGHVCLDLPGWGTFIGTIGVFIGLCLVVDTEPSYDKVSSATAVVGDSADVAITTTTADFNNSRRYTESNDYNDDANWTGIETTSIL